MATSVPAVHTLTTVEDFRKVVNENFSKQISEGQEYDARDIQRFNEVDGYTLMFIQHAQFGETFNERRAFRYFHETMVWRKQNNVYDVSTDQFPANYFDRHAIFYKHHDIHNHRILNYVIRTFNKGQEDNEAVKRFIIYNFEEHIRAYPGQKIAILFDMTNTGLRQLDYDLVKFVINSLLYYYPGLLSYMIIYKLPFILYAAWRIIKSWLPTETQNAIKFLDEKTITEYISPDQLPKAMGGTADD